MGGEELTEAFMGFSGFYGDRCFAFKNSSARKGFPYLNSTVQQQMLLYHPKFRYPERSAKPPNLTEARGIPPGANPANAEPNDLILDVVTPQVMSYLLMIRYWRKCFVKDYEVKITLHLFVQTVH
jgi:hypothetical protein